MTQDNTQMAPRHRQGIDWLAGQFTPGAPCFNQIEDMVPEGIDGGTFVANWFQHVWEQADKRPNDWANINVDTLRASLMHCASLGLQPDPRGHVYMVPFRGQITTIVGYRGMIALMKRGAGVVAVDAEVVYESDEFRYRKGLIDELHHVPNLRRSINEPMIAAYAKCTYPNGLVQFHVMTHAEIERVRQQFGGRSDSPWKKWPDRMARKSAIRQLFSLVGMDQAMAYAADLVDREMMGQHVPQLEAPAQPTAKPQKPAFALGLQEQPEHAQFDEDPAHMGA